MIIAVRRDKLHCNGMIDIQLRKMVSFGLWNRNPGHRCWLAGSRSSGQEDMAPGFVAFASYTLVLPVASAEPVLV